MFICKPSVHKARHEVWHDKSTVSTELVTLMVFAVKLQMVLDCMGEL